MTDREVMQQALEALEGVVRAHSYESGTPVDAIAALRTRLAEPEPVAKVELMTTGGNVGLATRIVEIDDHLRDRLRPGQLLYTAPPARRPLTDDEIDEATAQAADALLDHIYEYGTTAEGVRQRIRKLARAAERAHGIGGAK